MNSSVDENLVKKEEEEASTSSDSTETASMKLRSDTQLKTEIKEELVDTEETKPLVNDPNSTPLLPSPSHPLPTLHKFDDCVNCLTREVQNNLKIDSITEDQRNNIPVLNSLCDVNSEHRRAYVEFFEKRLPLFTLSPTGDPVFLTRNIHLISWNMNSSFNKRHQYILNKLMRERKVDVLCLQRIANGHEHEYNEMFKEKGYDYILLPPNSRREGGRGLLIVYRKEMENCIRNKRGGILKDHVHETYGDHFIEGEFEWIAMDLYLYDKWHTIVNFYHGYQTNPKEKCLQEICAFLNELSNESQNYLHIFGTMNQGVDKKNLEYIREQLKLAPTNIPSNAPHNAPPDAPSNYILKDILLDDFVTYYRKIERKKISKIEIQTTRPDIVLTKIERCDNTLASNCIVVHSSIKPFGTTAKVYHKLIKVQIGKNLSNPKKTRK